MTEIIAVLKERQFNTIVCIDDDHAVPVVDTIDSFAGALVEVNPRKRRNLAKAHPEFEKICAAAQNEDVDAETRRADVRFQLAALEREGALSGQLMSDAAAILFQGHAGKTQKALKGVFADEGIVFRAFSFGQWLEERDEVLASATENARMLILVDERNDNEPNVDLDGERVLADIFFGHEPVSEHIDAVVVTANCDPDDELEESHKLYKSIAEIITGRGKSTLFKKVFVLSKERLSHQDLAKDFVIHLDRIEASRLSSALADFTKSVMLKAVSESLDWLKQIPLMEFHNSIFVTAGSEGAAEIDTLVRLAAIRQRASLDKMLREDDKVRTCIEKMRKFPAGGFHGALPSVAESDLRELRSQEFERPHDHINVLKVPLACGDVFELNTIDSTGTKRLFLAMLLANPCDLAMRRDGARKLSTGLLVQVLRASNREIEALQNDRSGSPLLYKISTGGSLDDISYLFYNSKVESIPLSVLDLCWTNVEGKAVLNPSQVVETLNSLMPPQQARLVALCDRMKKERFSRVELWGHELELDTTERDPVVVGEVEMRSQIEYDLRRVWRLAPEFASAALSALSQSLARPAFGHDYRQS